MNSCRSCASSLRCSCDRPKLLCKGIRGEVTELMQHAASAVGRTVGQILTAIHQHHQSVQGGRPFWEQAHHRELMSVVQPATPPGGASSLTASCSHISGFSWEGAVVLSSILKATKDFVTSGLLMATLILKIVCRQPLTRVCPCCCEEFRPASGSMTAAAKLVQGAGGRSPQVRGQVNASAASATQ